ncbi:wax ester/triacylglycerol synthase family O-acyltransferase [Phycicoccus sp. MAQZ13P-2]|uniref:WS/DGAT/MGAT family O-acyltransferase n=1 Tax=Phycicoccus mangrovi TaxID=2840470 RepID=UPI001C003558|nr:wax ester/triacylglycerol synthase family O-acyltransferase [Phycicoccus mangrovi]MBT9256925.1 wax ester/triacylglycerol synthase family O-acyltransferase [Phycicoccus mangrovi]MBT9274926.1 wax ester/triacylglycerol synthase family O-acyltransferase [Phycicoccus mangrovi]
MPRSRWASPLDAVFLIGETPETLMHVGSLLHFSMPADADDAWLRDLVADVRASPVRTPWTYRLQTRRLLRQPVHRWVEDDAFDIDYHVRHSALPSGGGERELGVLVSRLHSNQLDFRRPPWELTFIEGVAPGQFAVYTKIHHSLVDGYTGNRLLQRGLTEDPDDRTHPHFLGLTRPPRAEGEPREPVGDVTAILRSIGNAVTSMPEVARTLVGTQLRRGGPSTRAVASYQAPVSILNGRTGRARRFATQQYELERLRAVARARNATLNDVLMAVCAGGLRRFLDDLASLPDRPLVAFVPVNVRAPESEGGGNYVGATLVSLATDIEDPVARLAAITSSSRAAKARMRGMGGDAVIAYSAMLLAPAGLQVLRAMSGLPLPGPLTLNVCISNVPGPTKPLYWRGARLDATYPVSIPGHSMALNITAQSYAGTLNLGFIGDRDALPHLQRLAVHTGAALEELEAATGTA